MIKKDPNIKNNKLLELFKISLGKNSKFDWTWSPANKWSIGIISPILINSATLVISVKRKISKALFMSFFSSAKKTFDKILFNFLVFDIFIEH